MPLQIPIPPVTKGQFLAPGFVPSITTWNRLEGRPRSQDFDRSLQAELRDPLWMLCRQWQVGEFRAEDAGSAVVAKTQVRTSRVNLFAGRDRQAQTYDQSAPLDMLAEHEPVPFDLFTRAQMGRHWLKLIAAIGNFKALYVNQFPFQNPPAGSEAEAQLRSDPQAWGVLRAMQGKLPDGGSLYLAMTSPVSATQPLDQHAAWLAGAVPNLAKRNSLNQAARAFQAWFQRTYSLPQAQAAPTWEPGYLEYQFACSAPAGAKGESQTVLVAEQFASGPVDWYSFDVDGGAAGLPAGAGSPPPAAAPETLPALSFIPRPVTFSGMPSPRWWEFEDSRVDLGNLKPSTTDLATLLMADFGMAYSNDWSLVPYVLPLGTLSQVLGVVVKDVFGVRTLVRPAGQTEGADQMRWGLFDLSLYRDDHVLEQLFLPPSASKLLESEPVEKVILVRDDMADMVWGVEHTLPALDEGSLNGFEAAKALEAYLAGLNPVAAGPASVVGTAPVRFQLGTSVPENWIPFIPVHNPGSNRDIRLQRAAMPRLVPGLPNNPIQPRGAFLRAGLDQAQPAPYFIHEEEVPRTGIILTRRYHRARWLNGKIVTWLGRQKQPGARFAQTGQASSGLEWDKIV